MNLNLYEAFKELDSINEAAVDSETADRFAKMADDRARRDAREQARWDAKQQACHDTLAAAINQVDPDLIDQYNQYTGLNFNDSCTIEAKQSRRNYQVFITTYYEYDYAIHVKNCPYYYTPSLRDWENVDKIADVLTKALKATIAQFKRKNDKLIDIFERGHTGYCVLLGESGVLYYVYNNGKSLTVSLSGFLKQPYEDVEYFTDMPESYKVVFTLVTEDDGNRQTYKNSYSRKYYSWDSSAFNKIAALVPEIGHDYGTWSEHTTIKVDNPNSDVYSKADGIDSWAMRSVTSYSTD